jgi:hypothetical protein
VRAWSSEFVSLVGKRAEARTLTDWSKVKLIPGTTEALVIATEGIVIVLVSTCVVVPFNDIAKSPFLYETAILLIPTGYAPVL